MFRLRHLEISHINLKRNYFIMNLESNQKKIITKFFLKLTHTESSYLTQFILIILFIILK